MENQEIQQNIKAEILHKIQSGEVKMRPKAFFVMKVAVLVFVAFVTFVVSVLLVSYTWFSMRAGGHFFLLGFGGRGLFEFFLVFPWLILLLDIALIFFLDWLLKRFKFGYHNPVLYIFIGSLLLITAGGTILNMTSFHKNVMYLAENKHLPIPGVGGFYIELRRTHRENGLFRGEVVSIATSSFIMKNGRFDASDSTNTIDVLTPPGFDVDLLLDVGDQVFIAGDIVGGDIRAYGVKKLTDDD